MKLNILELIFNYSNLLFTNSLRTENNFRNLLLFPHNSENIFKIVCIIFDMYK